jgi:tetratricopeptide (TPR) repeat protein
MSARLKRMTAWLVAIVPITLAAQLFAQADPDLVELVTRTNRSSEGKINSALLDSREKIDSTNFVPDRATGGSELGGAALKLLERQLEIARRQRIARLYTEAEPVFVSIVTTNAPEAMKRTALLELAIMAQDENELSRAQQIFAHYLTKWPDDPDVPEVMLRQGLIYRQMGLNTMALTKFYAVMTSSLVLKSEKIDFYQRLVLQAQTEIADTYFQQGKFAESVELFARLLKNNSPLLNKPQVHFKLIRSLSALGRHEEAVTQSFDFLSRHSESVEQPEVRFYLATSLKQLGRNNESMQQVMLLLQSQQGKAAASPSTWAYWQQKTGNEIANQLYKEGDYLRALQLYTGLAALNTNADWQLPVSYQIGLTFERLEQPAKALEQYSQILRRNSEVSTNSNPSLAAIIEMAAWRKEYLAWQTNMNVAAGAFRPATQTNFSSTQ